MVIDFGKKKFVPIFRIKEIWIKNNKYKKWGECVHIIGTHSEVL